MTEIVRISLILTVVFLAACEPGKSSGANSSDAQVLSEKDDQQDLIEFAAEDQLGQMSDQMKVTVPNLDGSTTALGAESVDALELLSLNEQIREEFVVAAQLKQEQELKGEEITNSGQHSVQPSRPVEILLFRALQAEREKKSNP
jgi:hypothetical protein